MSVRAGVIVTCARLDDPHLVYQDGMLVRKCKACQCDVGIAQSSITLVEANDGIILCVECTVQLNKVQKLLFKRLTEEQETELGDDSDEAADAARLLIRDLVRKENEKH